MFARADGSIRMSGQFYSHHMTSDAAAIFKAKRTERMSEWVSESMSSMNWMLGCKESRALNFRKTCRMWVSEVYSNTVVVWISEWLEWSGVSGRRDARGQSARGRADGRADGPQKCSMCCCAGERRWRARDVYSTIRMPSRDGQWGDVVRCDAMPWDVTWGAGRTALRAAAAIRRRLRAAVCVWVSSAGCGTAYWGMAARTPNEHTRPEFNWTELNWTESSFIHESWAVLYSTLHEQYSTVLDEYFSERVAYRHNREVWELPLTLTSCSYCLPFILAQRASCPLIH